jgi:hypothetical protein
MDCRALFNRRESLPPLGRGLKYHHRSHEGGCCGSDCSEMMSQMTTMFYQPQDQKEETHEEGKEDQLLPYRTLTRMKSDPKKEGKNV